MTTPIREVFVYGAGKVGTALGRGWRRSGLRVTVRAARRGWPRSLLTADVVVIAVRDRNIERAAGELARVGIVGRGRRRQAVVHCSGSLGPDALGAVRSQRVAVAQMHPLLAFAARGRPPELAGGLLLVRGDAPAVRAASRLGRLLGMRPQSAQRLDLALYHAAAALVSNGAAALAGQGAALLDRAGLPAELAPGALGPLLGSVAQNVERVGLPAALTGPIRRGDHGAVEAHLAELGRQAPEMVELYVALGRAQLEQAERLGDGSQADFRRVERALGRAAVLHRRRR